MYAVLAEAEASGAPIDGPDELLAQITKSVLERALDVEITDHLAMSTAIRPATARAIPVTATAAKPYSRRPGRWSWRYRAIARAASTR